MVDTRTKILNAASELFLENGIGSLSVRAISARAGMSTIGIYSHFKGKQGILDALYIEGFELVYQAMDVGVIDENGDEIISRENLLESAQGYLNVGDQYEAHYRLIFGESDAGYEPSKEACHTRDTAFNKLVHNAGLYLPGSVSRQERRQFALDIWAILHGYVSISHHTMISQSWDWKLMALNAVEIHIDALCQ